MDGITLDLILREMSRYLPLKVQRIQQPAKKEIVLWLWSREAREKLVLSMEDRLPFFGFSGEDTVSLPSPPGFCLALRKRLEGGTLAGVRQHGLDRVLYLDRKSVV